MCRRVDSRTGGISNERTDLKLLKKVPLPDC